MFVPVLDAVALPLTANAVPILFTLIGAVFVAHPEQERAVESLFLMDVSPTLPTATAGPVVALT